MSTPPTPDPSPSQLDLSQFSSGRRSRRPSSQTPSSGRKVRRTQSSSPYSSSCSSKVDGRVSGSQPAQQQELADPQETHRVGRIKAMDAQASQTIRAAHTILDTAAIVKELVENSLDAGATRVDVRLRGKAGLDSIVVSDNGSGVRRCDHATLCQSSTTSKLRHDTDMSSANFSTFGFRGEALSAIRRVCASMSIVTRSADDQTATSLTFAPDGSLSQSVPAARPVGTTVSVSRVFYALPVRRKDAVSNAPRELARCISVVQALAIISVNARVELRVANDLKVRSSSNLATPRTKVNDFSLNSLRTSAQSILGTRASATLLDVKKRSIATVTIPPAFRVTHNNQSSTNQDKQQSDESQDEKMGTQSDNSNTEDNRKDEKKNVINKFKTEYQCMGLVSRAALDANGSGGRARSSHHYMFVNERPVDFPRIARAANEVYRRATGLASASPTLILNFGMPPWACDVNLAPDKRHVLVHEEDLLITGVVKMLEETWIPTTAAPIPLQKTNVKQQSSILSAFSKSTLSKPPDISKETPTPEPCTQSPIAVKSDVIEPNDCERTELDKQEIDAPPLKSDSGNQRGEHSSDPPQNTNQVEEPENREDEKDKLENVVKKTSDSISQPQPSELPTSTPIRSPQSKNAGEAQVSLFSQDGKLSIAELSNRLRRNGGAKRLRDGNFAHSAKEVMSTDFSQMSHRDVLKMTSKRQDILQGRRSVLEYAGQRAKRVSSLRTSFLLGGHDDCECHPRKPGLRRTGIDTTESVGRQPFPPDSRIRHHDPSLGSPPDSTEYEEDVVMDGNADDDIKLLSSSQNSTQLVLQVDWDMFCEEDDKDDDYGDDDDDPSGLKDSKDLVSETGFEKASMANGGENIEIEVADQELSRLFRQEWFKQLRVIGQFNRGFILGQLGREVFIIDQHASDEKYNYEQLEATTQLQRQALVIPRRLEMSAEDELIVVQHLGVLNASGYDIRYDESKPPTDRLTLHSQPVSKHIVFGESDLNDIVYLLKNGMVNSRAGKLKPPRVKAMLASRACRKSIMIGSALHRHQMKQVLEHLSGILHPWTCPHGRPTMRHLCTLSQLT